MKILYLHQHFVARSGTSGGRSHEFSRLWVRNGHRVTLITGAFEHSGLSWPPEKRGARFQIDGIEVRGLRVPYSQYMSPARRIRSFVSFMLSACREAMRVERPEVVFATSPPLTVAVPAIWAARWHRCPLVFETRDLWPAAPIEFGILTNPALVAVARGLERLAYRRAAHIVALSPGMKDGIVGTGVDSEKVTVIPNASDLELLRVPPEVGQVYRGRHGKLGERPWVVYAGASGRVNALDWVVTLADAVRRLEPDIAFLFFASGSEEDRILAAAKAAGILEENFFWMGRVPRSELAAVLSAATVVCSFFVDLPVMRTNSANKFFDALAAGRPVVINYGGWQAELLERTGAGLALDRNDVGGSARSLVQAVCDPGWLERAGGASARLGETEFDRRRLAARLERVLQHAVERGGRGENASIGE